MITPHIEVDVYFEWELTEDLLDALAEERITFQDMENIGLVWGFLEDLFGLE